MIVTALLAAAFKCGMSDGVVFLVNGTGTDIGEWLVADPRICAVGFTGSRRGGLALDAIAKGRQKPIPVFAEMSSVNPVIVMPHALSTRTDQLAQDYVASIVMGAGQFCTNPGLLLAVEGQQLAAFSEHAATVMQSVTAQTMLTAAIHDAYVAATQRLGARRGAMMLARGQASTGLNQGVPELFSVSGSEFLLVSAYSDEIFGATSLIVRCRDLAELATIIESLEGQLTATLHIDHGDAPDANMLIPMLESRAGRIIVNGWPTGVEVSAAIVHGGPFPATSDGRSTSVGTLAIDRFLRPVCRQGFPDWL